MSQDNKDAVIKEVETDINEITAENDENQKSPIAKFDDVIDSVKEATEKATEFIGDAAKTAGDFADTQLKQAKSVFDKVKNSFEDEIARRNIEKYRPVFPSAVEDNTLNYPKMINVVDFDKRMGIEECKGAIGFQQKIKDTELLAVYKNDANQFKELRFYPDRDPSASVYYVHPLDPTQYIEITEYFNYLKEQRITELEYIAQELGAKHFKVQIMEETLSNDVKKANANAKLGVKKDRAGVKVDQSSSNKEYAYIGIAAENTYPGKEPKEPVLKLWANNESIKSLVKQRLSSDNPLQSKTFKLDYNTCSGIKEKEAAKIDGVLKVLKFGANGSIQKEAQKESKRRLEYTIEF